MRIRINKPLLLLVLQQYPQAKNGPFGLLHNATREFFVAASCPKRAGYDQKRCGPIFA
jgi:hypothetical protein